MVKINNSIFSKSIIFFFAFYPFVSFGQQYDTVDTKLDDDNIFGFYLGKSTVDEVVNSSRALTECTSIQKILKIPECPLEKSNYITLYSIDLKPTFTSLKEIDKIVSLKKQESDRVLILLFYDEILFQIQVAPKHYMYTFQSELDAELIKSLIPIFNNKYNKLKSNLSSSKSKYSSEITTAQLWENKNKNFKIEIKEIKRKLDNRNLCLSASMSLSGSRKASEQAFCSSGQDVSFYLTYRNQQIYNEAYTYVNERIKELEKEMGNEKKKKLSTY